MTALDTKAPSLADAKAALRDHSKRIAHDPRTNSVFAYAQDLFRALEQGDISLDDLGTTTQSVFGDLILARADRFRRQHEDSSDLAKRLDALAAQGWDVFRQATETPTGGIVFTAHPTFALSRDARAAFASQVSDASEASANALKTAIKQDGRAWSQSISLLGEHDEAQDTIAHAQTALSAYASLVLDVARRAFPDKWRSLMPRVPTLASWVGYDLDGRTDIHWSQSFALRLKEKAVQLSRYVSDLQAIMEQAGGDTKAALSEISDALEAAASLTEAEADIFSEDLTNPENLVHAANQLTSEQPDRIIKTQPIIDQLRAISEAETDDAVAQSILVLAIKVDALKLGTARIHLRLNAEQIRTVISRDLGLETENRDLGRSALKKLSELAAVDEPHPVNFADLLLEQSTARRQFMMCAQFLKHIDAGSTIRFLIAESLSHAGG